MRDYTEAKEQQLGSLGCRSHGLLTLMAQLFYLALFTVLLVAFLVQVPKVPSTKDQESIYQKLTKLKVEVDLLCRPCPWDWMLFQNNCYFFSKSKRNWTYSITACEDMGAQLVITTIEEEKSFLQEISKKNGKAWIGLSDLKQEGSWQWVDGSLLLFSFSKFWNTGEPNNVGDDEDCVELDGDGWNDADCTIKKFWICKKSVTSCSKK